MPSVTVNRVGAFLTEFLVALFKLLWYTLVGMVKVFLPVQKKDVRKEVVLVTGAGSGIGRLMSLRFAELGALVVLWDVNSEANNAVCEEIRGRGGRATAFTCDLSDKDQIYQTAAKVKQDIGNVTVLINNAGIVTGKKLLECSDNVIEKTLQINTMAHFWTIKSFLPDMISKNHGHVITIASAAGLFGVAGLMDYCASKFGAVGISESLTMELDLQGCTGVNTTCVCPFFINTGMFDGVKSRVPLLLPILSPEYAVNKIMDAYHSNQAVLMMPRLLYITYFIQSFVPKKAALELAKVFGIPTVMSTFKGRPEKKD